jgi:3'-phosphoadenosine 5'-phosphosulfate (PAPS) 3'-phosphatase
LKIVYVTQRIPTTDEEKIWDHAAGALIIQEAGGYFLLKEREKRAASIVLY